MIWLLIAVVYIAISCSWWLYVIGRKGRAKWWEKVIDKATWLPVAFVYFLFLRR